MIPWASCQLKRTPDKRWTKRRRPLKQLAPKTSCLTELLQSRATNALHSRHTVQRESRKQQHENLGCAPDKPSGCQSRSETAVLSGATTGCAEKNHALCSHQVTEQRNRELEREYFRQLQGCQFRYKKDQSSGTDDAERASIDWQLLRKFSPVTLCRALQTADLAYAPKHTTLSLNLQQIAHDTATYVKADWV